MFLLFIFSVVVGATVNKYVRREIDLSTNIVRHNVEVTLQTTDDHFHIAVPTANATQLARIHAERDDQPLRVAIDSKVPAGIHREGVDFYKVQLGTTDGDVVVKLVYTFVDVLHPFPRAVGQNDNQLVVYYDSRYFFSPYDTEKQSTTVTLASKSVESYTTENADKKDDVITYGTFRDIGAFAAEPLRIHYENNSPFVKTVHLKRTLQVSHWGVLSVEEAYHIKHVGAEFTGVFSRLEFTQRPSPTAVSSVTAELPVDATDIYFRDVIGNISTSVVRPAGRGIEVDFQQRFPLLGGWQTDFYFGYNLPLHTVLRSEDGSYKLELSFASPMKNMHVSELEVQVILPEGTSNVKTQVAGKDHLPKESITKTYLDTTGRTTLTLVETNVVSPDNDDILQVSYTFSSMSMLHEPILLMSGFFCFFVITLVLVRL